MSNVKETFSTLQDASGAGVTLTKSVAGDSATGKNGETVFNFKDSSGNIQLGNLDSSGNLLVSNTPRDGIKATYSACASGLVAVATPTDIFTISGSSTKTIRITRLGLSATQNTSSVRDVFIIKRSSANSGGTATNPAAVPHDSGSAAATAVVTAYTANPSLGNTVGTIRAMKVDIEATNLVGASDHVELRFGEGPSQCVILRGTAESLCVNLNSITSSNSSFDIYVEWSEES